MNNEVWNIGIVKELEKRSKEVPEVKLLIGQLQDISKQAAILLDRVADTFLEYTLHEKTHSLNLLKIMDRIIPEETLNQMNELELTILALSAFLHDIGMVVSRQEKKEVLESEHFKQFKEKYPRINHSLKRAQDEGDYRTATQIEDQLLTYYLRESHAVRGADFIKKKFDAKLQYRDLDYSDLVCTVCRSHGEPWEKLGVRRERLHGYPLREEYSTSHSFMDLEINVQFLAMILRIADILDFDRERTPPILFEYLYPIGEVSLGHWLAHLSVQGWVIGKGKIKYRVECEHPLYQKTVNDFLDKIDHELQGISLLMEKFPAEIAEKYKIDLPRVVDRSEIGPKIIKGKPSYIYGDFQFGLDYDRVIALLGEELQYDETVAIRELLQNSVDACKHRLALEKVMDTDWSKRKAKIHFIHDQTAQTLTVRDNGIGMDQEIVQNHFLRIGCSYYSKDNSRYLSDLTMFEEKGVAFYPISKFGIGILSSFTLADLIEVTTRRKEYDHLCKPMSIRISPKLKIYVMKELESSDWPNGNEPGTIIKLHLNRSMDFKKILTKFAINLEFDVSVTTDGRTAKIRPHGFGLDCFPEIKKVINDHLKEKRLASYAVDLSKSRIEGVRGKTTIFFPYMRGKLLIPGHDRIDYQALEIEESLFERSIEQPVALREILTTSQGIHVPRGFYFALPFPHITVIDFFGKSRPELTLDRRSFKGEVGILRGKLYDFISGEIGRRIGDGTLNFYSPFWEFLWEAPSSLQSFFLRDSTSRSRLFKLPLLFEGKKKLVTYGDIRKRFPKGICVVFQRHSLVQTYANFLPDTYGNYSTFPPDLPLLALDPGMSAKASKGHDFWKELLDLSHLILVEKEDCYFLRIKLSQEANPIYKDMYKLRPSFGLRTPELRFAKYQGIPKNIVYSNNAAKALNLNHPLVILFLSSLEKANSSKEITLMQTFHSFLNDICFEDIDLPAAKALKRKLYRSKLIPHSAMKLFESNSLRVRSSRRMSSFFLSPPPVAFAH